MALLFCGSKLSLTRPRSSCINCHHTIICFNCLFVCLFSLTMCMRYKKLSGHGCCLWFNRIHSCCQSNLEQNLWRRNKKITALNDCPALAAKTVKGPRFSLQGPECVCCMHFLNCYCAHAIPYEIKQSQLIP
jgi:hypothetical protein